MLLCHQSDVGHQWKLPKRRVRLRSARGGRRRDRDVECKRDSETDRCIRQALREAVALGNIAAVRVFLAQGVLNVNAQNAVNGWTPLHWACSRGHHDIAQLLIKYGARTDIANSKGQTPRDLIRKKDSALESLFPAASLAPSESAPAAPASAPAPAPEADADSGSASFVPSYLAYPEVNKLWSVPDAASIIASLPQPTAEPLAPSAPAPSASAPQQPSQIQEQQPVRAPAAPAAPAAPTATPPMYSPVLVYLDRCSPDAILGAVFVHQRQSLGQVAEQIRRELDGVPESFTLLRCDGDLCIPIGSGQSSQPALMHLQALSPLPAGAVQGHLQIVVKSQTQ
ncbi:hypothetical protein BC831DRAFT_473116 [Entophlyctis helioformis]|nr:hypothetical protein BC831DRAFT_473116 [Entophlyctis helioformis]